MQTRSIDFRILIRGYAGVGKTTFANAFVEALYVLTGKPQRDHAVLSSLGGYSLQAMILTFNQFCSFLEEDDLSEEIKKNLKMQLGPPVVVTLVDTAGFDVRAGPLPSQMYRGLTGVVYLVPSDPAVIKMENLANFCAVSHEKVGSEKLYPPNVQVARVGTKFDLVLKNSDFAVFKQQVASRTQHEQQEPNDTGTSKNPHPSARNFEYSLFDEHLYDSRFYSAYLAALSKENPIARSFLKDCYSLPTLDCFRDDVLVLTSALTGHGMIRFVRAFIRAMGLVYLNGMQTGPIEGTRNNYGSFLRSDLDRPKPAGGRLHTNFLQEISNKEFETVDLKDDKKVNMAEKNAECCEG